MGHAGYDAWLEQPYQDKYERDDAIDRVQEAVECDAVEVAEALFDLSQGYESHDRKRDASWDDLERAEVLVLANDALNADNAAFEAAAVRYFWKLRKSVMAHKYLAERAAEIVDNGDAGEWL